MKKIIFIIVFLLSVVCWVLIAYLRPSGESIIYSEYFVVPLSLSDPAGKIINSKEDLKNLIDEVQTEELKRFLEAQDNFEASDKFIYVTYNSELSKLQSVPGMSTRIALLKRRSSGVGVNLIRGSSSPAIKATIDE